MRVPTPITLIVIERGKEPREVSVSGLKLCLVGRAHDCDIQLCSEAANLDASRHHCEFEIDGTRVRVRDLESLIGTYINGRRIGGRCDRWNPDSTQRSYSGTVELTDGDEVRIGHTVICVRIEVPAELPEPVLFPSGMLWPI